MGGIGSGWFERRSARMRTDEYPWVDVRRLGCNSRRDRYVILDGGTLAELEWRACYFGGYRPYFQCLRCARRCCILYRFRTRGKGADCYGCPNCLGMVHPVENEDRLERAVRRNNKDLKRQGYDVTRPEGKPLWMRWLTWRRLSEKVTQGVLERFDYHEKLVRLLRHLDGH